MNQEVQEKYKKYVEKKTPKNNVYMNMVRAFLVGGSICCIGQAILQILKMKPSEYELQYSHIPSFWKYAELDDNDIVCATKDKWWVIALRIVLWLIPIALGAEMLIFLEGFWKNKPQNRS